MPSMWFTSAFVSLLSIQTAYSFNTHLSCKIGATYTQSGSAASCGSKQNDAGLCYTVCRSGYLSAGPMCWEECDSGYTELAVICSKTSWCYKNVWGVKVPYPCTDAYTRDSYGRGVGTIPSSCSSGYHNVVGTCYKDCKEDYIGGSVLCTCDFMGYLEYATDFIDGIAGDEIRAIAGPIIETGTDIFDTLNAMKVDPEVELAKFGDIVMSFKDFFSASYWEDISVAVVEISAAGHVLAGASIAVGIAFDLSSSSMPHQFYWTHCEGVATDIDFGVGISVLVFDSLDDIPGDSHAINSGLELGFAAQFGAGLEFVVSAAENPEFLGFGLSVSAGAGLSPIEFGWHLCETEWL